MADYDRTYYIDLMEKAYFANVMKEDIPASCDCFTEDAEVVIYHGDNPVRRFYGTPQDGQLPLDALYGHIFANYTVRFENFEHTVDVDAERCACNFTVTLTPKPGSAYADTGVLHLNNSNFFRCRDGKFYFMIIYYANPTLGAKLGIQTQSPTAFPKE